MNKLLALTMVLAACMSSDTRGTAPRCPPRPEPPSPLVCPDDTVLFVRQDTRFCAPADAPDETPNAPSVQFADGEIVGFTLPPSADDPGYTLASYRGAWTWRRTDAPRDEVLLHCSAEGRLLRRAEDTRLQIWDEAGRLVEDVHLDQGRETRRRLWSDDTLLLDASRDGRLQRWAPDGTLIAEADLEDGHPIGRIRTWWPDGTERQSVLRERSDAGTPEPMPSLDRYAPRRDDGARGLEPEWLCSRRVDGLFPHFARDPPPGHRCVGEIFVWNAEGERTLEAHFDALGRRTGHWQSEVRRGVGAIRSSGWSAGRRLWVARRSDDVPFEILSWSDGEPIAREAVWSSDLESDHLGTLEETLGDLVGSGPALRVGEHVHRTGTWRISTTEGTAVRTEQWIDGRLGDVTLHAQHTTAPASGPKTEVGASTARWVPTEDRQEPATVERVAGLPPPDTPVRREALDRVAARVDAASPDDLTLFRWCWVALPDISPPLPRERWEAPAVDAGGPSGLAPAHVVELLRRLDTRQHPVGRAACIGDVRALAFAGPPWRAVHDELLARRAHQGLGVELAVLRSAVRSRLLRADPDWDADLPPGLADPDWDPWIAGWNPLLLDPDAPMPARLRRTRLGQYTLWWISAPGETSAARTTLLATESNGQLLNVCDPPEGLVPLAETEDGLTVRRRDGREETVHLAEGRPPYGCRGGYSVEAYLMSAMGEPLTLSP